MKPLPPAASPVRIATGPAAVRAPCGTTTPPTALRLRERRGAGTTPGTAQRTHRAARPPSGLGRGASRASADPGLASSGGQKGEVPGCARHPRRNARSQRRDGESRRVGLPRRWGRAGQGAARGGCRPTGGGRHRPPAREARPRRAAAEPMGAREWAGLRPGRPRPAASGAERAEGRARDPLGAAAPGALPSRPLTSLSASHRASV